MINGKPYQLHSQGVVERAHRTIKKDLIVKFIGNTRNFNIEEELKLVCINYNKKVHKVTKYSPLEIFFSTDSELYKKVYNNTLDFYNKNTKNNLIYEINEKIL